MSSLLAAPRVHAMKAKTRLYSCIYWNLRNEVNPGSHIDEI